MTATFIIDNERFGVLDALRGVYTCNDHTKGGWMVTLRVSQDLRVDSTIIGIGIATLLLIDTETFLGWTRLVGRVLTIYCRYNNRWLRTEESWTVLACSGGHDVRRRLAGLGYSSDRWPGSSFRRVAVNHHAICYRTGSCARKPCFCQSITPRGQTIRGLDFSTSFQCSSSSLDMQPQNTIILYTTHSTLGRRSFSHRLS
ncbi:hypothetical protein BC835DRAFT_864388 [Cytidiella melzeri]|nr:hypothetical protein BC835DRAFT_864388 [Cytidiella melzeri]